jgi:hypothetical protein
MEKSPRYHAGKNSSGLQMPPLKNNSSLGEQFKSRQESIDWMLPTTPYGRQSPVD